MTQSQTAGFTTRPMPTLTERENQRAVELIESAERTAYCHCGSHMLAVAQGDEIWLECAEHTKERAGVAALVARLTALAHSRRRIMELPSAN